LCSYSTISALAAPAAANIKMPRQADAIFKSVLRLTRKLEGRLFIESGAARLQLVGLIVMDIYGRFHKFIVKMETCQYNVLDKFAPVSRFALSLGRHGW
jgi:hypothetical protein